MQTLRSLAQKSSHSKVFDIIREYYYKDRNTDDLIQLSLTYRKVVKDLIDLPSNPDSKFKIYITEKECDEKGEKFIDVCFYNEDDDELFALDLTSWENLIDLEIYKAVEMDDYSALAHILWEITFWGWSDDKIKEERDSLSKASMEATEELHWPPPWNKTPF